MQERVLPGRLAWVCGSCQGPIITGAVHIDFSDIREAERSHKRYSQNRSDDAQDLDAFVAGFDGPRVACWSATCDGCRIDSGHNCGNCYAIDMNQIQSVWALWKWTRQMHGKSWFEVTNWIEFACNVADRTAPSFEPTGVR